MADVSVAAHPGPDYLLGLVLGDGQAVSGAHHHVGSVCKINKTNYFDYSLNHLHNPETKLENTSNTMGTLIFAKFGKTFPRLFIRAELCDCLLHDLDGSAILTSVNGNCIF